MAARNPRIFVKSPKRLDNFTKAMRQTKIGKRQTQQSQSGAKPLSGDSEPPSESLPPWYRRSGLS
jgi:hypothetical protein